MAISEGGICVVAEQLLKTDSYIRIRLALLKNKKHISLRTRVAWNKRLTALNMDAPLHSDPKPDDVSINYGYGRLDAIVARCLKGVPADRYQKVSDLLADLEPLVPASFTQTTCTCRGLTFAAASRRSVSVHGRPAGSTHSAMA